MFFLITKIKSFFNYKIKI